MTKLLINAEYVRLAHGFASTEETRYYLKGVQVEPHPSGVGVLIIATDGHRAGIFYDRDGIADKNYLLDLDKPTLAALKTQKSDTKKNRLVTIVNDKLTIVRESEGFEYHIKPNAVEIDGTFPEWRRIVPEHFENERPATINAVLLTPFIAVAKSLGTNPKVAVLTLTTGDMERGPISCRVEHDDFMGVVMSYNEKLVREPACDWIN